MRQLDEVLKMFSGFVVLERGDDGAALKYNSLGIVVSWMGGWEHVSVSHPKRLPSYDEMCHIKRLFWNPDEWVVHFYPPDSEHVNNHATCLHLWRPTEAVMPTPPSWMVGYKGLGTIA